jgi:hypothetical protein
VEAQPLVRHKLSLQESRDKPALRGKDPRIETTPEKREHPVENLRSRLTFVGPALAVAFLIGWATWFAPWDDLLDRRGTPLGADFSMFYVAGRVVLEGHADHLYDQAFHQQRLHSLFPGIDPQFCLPYRYPPFVAWLMAPLSALPYHVSFLIFLALSLAAAGVACAVLTRQFATLQGTWQRPLLLGFLGWPVLWETLMGGQASTLGLAILSVAVVLLARGRYAWAGAVFALAAYKPNLLALVVLGCVIRHPRMLRGLVPTLALLLLAAFLPAGWAGVRDYVEISTRLAAGSWDVETPLWKLHGLSTWFALVPQLPARSGTLVVGMIASVAVGLLWRRLPGAAGRAVFPLAIALLISINAVLNPYTPIYDLLLLAVGGLATAEWFRTEARAPSPAAIQLGLAVLCFGPHCSQAVAQRTGVQPLALLLAACCGWLAMQFIRAAVTSFPPVPVPEPAGSLHR